MQTFCCLFLSFAVDLQRFLFCYYHSFLNGDGGIFFKDDSIFWTIAAYFENFRCLKTSTAIVKGVKKFIAEIRVWKGQMMQTPFALCGQLQWQHHYHHDHHDQTQITLLVCGHQSWWTLWKVICRICLRPLLLHCCCCLCCTLCVFVSFSQLLSRMGMLLMQLPSSHHYHHHRSLSACVDHILPTYFVTLGGDDGSSVDVAIAQLVIFSGNDYFISFFPSFSWSLPIGPPTTTHSLDGLYLFLCLFFFFFFYLLFSVNCPVLSAI